jgi:hypothetical protein
MIKKERIESKAREIPINTTSESHQPLMPMYAKKPVENAWKIMKSIMSNIVKSSHQEIVSFFLTLVDKNVEMSIKMAKRIINPLDTKRLYNIESNLLMSL